MGEYRGLTNAPLHPFPEPLPIQLALLWDGFFVLDERHNKSPVFVADLTRGLTGVS
ncbi:hypothetical protein KSX_71840 [Ktedonospora formicarum]|uniref:Uncharacterized protein n=1 Tax=Ktedonospora formicarum TaxID=2778364 RepID=A0A8J3I7R8_9CHLR|nr:hypothetical protein KSX_71840 [Ktedonospora formicarum]